MMTVRVYRDGTGYEKTYSNVYDVEVRDGVIILYTGGESIEDDGVEMFRIWDGWDYEIDEWVQYAE